jgi:Concanavalin A-like lectin/glucanases superfamily
MKHRILNAACLLVPAIGGLLAHQSRAAIVIQSQWALGEGASLGLDSTSANDGELNPFNNSAGTVVLTASPSGVAGSTHYARTSGANFQGIWMFGAGSNNQTVPSSNWGINFMVRSYDTASIAGTGAFRSVFGMKDSASGGLVIEALRASDGKVYWDVNNSGVANLITPRNAATQVVDNVWTNLALVHNGSTLEFYVNRTLVGTKTSATQGTTYSTDGLLAFGVQQGVGTHQFKGDFDEARFFTFGAGAFNPATDLLSVSAIPEPGSVLGLAGMLGGAVLVRRRSRGGAD